MSWVTLRPCPASYPLFRTLKRLTTYRNHQVLRQIDDNTCPLSYCGAADMIKREPSKYWLNGFTSLPSRSIQQVTCTVIMGVHIKCPDAGYEDANPPSSSTSSLAHVSSSLVAGTAPASTNPASVVEGK